MRYEKKFHFIRKAHALQLFTKIPSFQYPPWLTVHGDCLSKVVFEKERPNYAASPNSTPKTNFFRIKLRLVNFMWVGTTLLRKCCLFRYPFIQKCVSTLKMIFSAKILQTLHNPVSELTAMSMIINFEVGPCPVVRFFELKLWKAKFLLTVRNWLLRLFLHTSMAHSFRLMRCSSDVQELAYSLRNHLSGIWPPNVG